MLDSHDAKDALTIPCTRRLPAGRPPIDRGRLDAGGYTAGDLPLGLLKRETVVQTMLVDLA